MASFSIVKLPGAIFLLFVGSMCIEGREPFDIEQLKFQGMIAGIWTADAHLRKITLNTRSGDGTNQKLFPTASLMNFKDKLTVKLLLTLFEIYDSGRARDDHLDQVAKKFIYELVHTKPFKVLREYLEDYRVLPALDKKTFQDLIFDIWFRR